MLVNGVPELFVDHSRSRGRNVLQIYDTAPLLTHPGQYHTRLLITQRHMNFKASEITGTSYVYSAAYLGKYFKQIKVSHYFPFVWGVSTDDRWISFTKGQYCVKRLLVMLCNIRW